MADGLTGGRRRGSVSWRTKYTLEQRALIVRSLVNALVALSHNRKDPGEIKKACINVERSLWESATSSAHYSRLVREQISKISAFRDQVRAKEDKGSPDPNAAPQGPSDHTTGDVGSGQAPTGGGGGGGDAGNGRRARPSVSASPPSSPPNESGSPGGSRRNGSSKSLAASTETTAGRVAPRTDSAVFRVEGRKSRKLPPAAASGQGDGDDGGGDDSAATRRKSSTGRPPAPLPPSITSAAGDGTDDAAEEDLIVAGIAAKYLDNDDGGSGATARLPGGVSAGRPPPTEAFRRLRDAERSSRKLVAPPPSLPDSMKDYMLGNAPLHETRALRQAGTSSGSEIGSMADDDPESTEVLDTLIATMEEAEARPTAQRYTLARKDSIWAQFRDEVNRLSEQEQRELWRVRLEADLGTQTMEERREEAFANETRHLAQRIEAAKADPNTDPADLDFMYRLMKMAHGRYKAHLFGAYAAFTLETAMSSSGPLPPAPLSAGRSKVKIMSGRRKAKASRSKDAPPSS